MYQVHHHLNKYTGIYRCPDNIHNFKMRVRIKEIPDISIATETELKENWEVRELKWQQKIFNNYEKQYYIDEKNCHTEAEKQYNSTLMSSVSAPDDKILFTYVDNDNFILNAMDSFFVGITRKEVHENENSLDEVLENEADFEYSTFLQQAIENINISENNVAMYIMIDTGEYIHENWIKDEHVLFIVKYNQEKGTLKVHPDFSKNIPYVLQIDQESTKNYYYYVENISEDMPDQFTLIEDQIFKKISDCRKSLKNIVLNKDFDLPPRNKLEVHIFFEIISGKKFEYNDVYVRYFIDLPDKWSCGTPELLEGKTQTCHANVEDDPACFGHIFDLVLEYDIQDSFDMGFPKYPYIYFEIISRGSWNRYRCEGITYHHLPVAKPGSYQFNLQCFRLTKGVQSELRRFFIGDCSNYSDITWAGLPKTVEGSHINKFGVETVGTGELKTRMNVLHQSQAFLSKYNEAEVIRNKEKLIFEKLNSSSLVKSVEQVLEAFKKAKKNLIQARNM